MKKIKVGGCRLPISLDIASNLNEIKSAIDWAAENNIDIMSTPECALSGYLWKPIGIKDPIIEKIETCLHEICEYSKAKNVDLILGTAWLNQYRHWNNTQKFIVKGECVHTYTKSVLYREEQSLYSTGNEVGVIRYRDFNIAGLICNDAWSNPFIFKDHSRYLLETLARQHVDIIFVSANVPQDVRPRQLWYDWHKNWLAMASSTLQTAFVVSDIVVSDVDNGPVSPVGVCSYPNLWTVIGDDYQKNYYCCEIVQSHEPKTIFY